MQPKISIIIPVKARLEHFKQCISYLLKQDYQNIEVIAVDYNCPDKTAQWIAENIADPRVKCVEVKVKKNEWNLSKARNKGYYSSTGEVLLFLDADALLLNPVFLQRCIDKMVEGSFLCGWGGHDATGCCMLWRVAFEQVKGYNELLQGWGMDDIDLYNRLEHVLCIERRVWPRGIQTIKHDDAVRALYQEEKDIFKTNIANGEISRSGQFKGLKEIISLERIKNRLNA